MFLVVRDGYVDQRNTEIEPLLDLDPDVFEVFEWNEPLPVWHPELGEERPLDPRTPAQKSQHVRERYRQRRIKEYPSVAKQLDMMYWDAINGTTIWVDEIKRIKERHPKPEAR